MSLHLSSVAIALVLSFGSLAHAQPSTFGFDAATIQSSNGEAESVAIGDVSGDDRDDLVIVNNAYSGNTASNQVLIRLQQADGTLAAPLALSYTTSYGSRRGIVLSDLDGDGVKDIAIGYGNGLALLRRDGNRGFILRNVATARGNDQLVSLDVDRNGVADLVGLSWSNGATIYYSDGYGGIASQVALSTNAQGWNDMEVADLSGDQIDDLAVMSGQGLGPNLSVHRHDGMAALLPPQTYSVGASELTAGVALGDFNGDGRNDAVLSRARNSPTHLWLYQQDSDGVLQPMGTLPSYQIPDTLEAADVNRDGRSDVLVLHSGWSQLGLYQQGTTGLGSETLYPIPYQSWYNPQGLAIGDLDGDGCSDAAIALNSSGVATLRGRGCAANADLAVGIVANAREISVNTRHRSGMAVAEADLQVVFRWSRPQVGIKVPTACTLVSAARSYSEYNCKLGALQLGGQRNLVFTAVGRGTLTVSADVASELPDLNESNNSTTATLYY